MHIHRGAEGVATPRVYACGSRDGAPMRLPALLLLLAQAAICADPKLGPKITLFNGTNLDGFYTYLEKHGVARDPNGVFRARNGNLYISGAEYGYLITTKSYSDYYLRVEFRWGKKTHPPREGKARDSGILFHVSGEDKIWPRSLEFQIIEGGTGDLILVGGAAITVGGQTRNDGRFNRLGKGPWKDVTGHRGPAGEVEKAPGKWNRLELWAEVDRVRFYVNGKLVNEGSNASLTRGQILFQSEGAELEFRKIELRQIEGR